MKKLLSALTCALLINCAAAEARPDIVPRALKKSGEVEAVVPVVKDREHSEAAAKISEILAKAVESRLAEYEVLAAADAKNRSRYSFHASYKVKYNDNALLSIALRGYEYTGGAHGISWQESVTADLETGKVFQLGDLFQSGSGYQKIIDERIAQEINRRAEWRGSVRFPGVSADTGFYLTEEALVIYYQPYEIAAYVFGLPTFVLDRYELNDLLVDEVRSKI
ncbi:MAG: DUF3298 and DUF4163 domain-containing protein [Acidaminococcales bacterium]|jgi:hypothetical protein|nr:DUF3298 and DUF4163 domain-containing protein [Acidaminococcales bacterium]